MTNEITRDSVLQCPECGGEMHFISEYNYLHHYGRMVTGDIYHCEECGSDDVIERKWEKVAEERRKYWHG